MRSFSFITTIPIRHQSQKPTTHPPIHLRWRLPNRRSPNRVSPIRFPARALTSADKEIITLALPALGALALDPLLTLIDTAFIGRLGVVALAGTGVATLVLNISFTLFNFLCISITPLVAHAIKRSIQSTSRVTANGLLLALLLGCLSGTFITSFATPLALVLGASAESLTPAVRYLRIRAVAAPFALASFVANGALRGHKDLRTPFRIAIIANFVNIILDFILIFPCQLGVSGAALATSLSQILAFSLMLQSLTSKGRLLLRDMLRVPSITEVLPMLSAGAMLCIRTLSLLVTISYATSTAAARGVVEMAAYELCRQLWVFKSTILDSLAAAAQVLVATALASNMTTRARDVAKRTIRLSALFGLILGLSAIFAGISLPLLFTSSRDVAVQATKCIRIAALCAPLNGAVFALDGVLAACEDYRYLAGAIAMASFVTCGVITGVRWFNGDVVAVWAGLNTLMIARGIVLFWRFWGNSSPIQVEEKEA